MTFEQFCREQGGWSQDVFGSDAMRGPVGPLKHLRKEVEEALADPSDKMEYVDCFFLVIDAARRAGIGPTELLTLAEEKLAINRARKWAKPTSDEPVEHERGESDSLQTKLTQAIEESDVLKASLDKLDAKLAQAEADREEWAKRFNHCCNQAVEHKARIAELEKMVEIARVALNDWARTYAPEEYAPEYVLRSKNRIYDKGGTSAYIADLLQTFSKTLRGTYESHPATNRASGTLAGEEGDALSRLYL